MDVSHTALFVDIKQVKIDAPCTTVLALPLSVIETAMTGSLQERTVNTISTRSLAFVNTATAEPLQEGIHNAIHTVWLAIRDNHISSRETSSNLIMVENRMPYENRSPVYGRVIYALVSYIALIILSGMTCKSC